MLREVFLSILCEQDEPGDVIALPDDNVVVSFFDQEKKINLAPFTKEVKQATNVRALINLLKGKFKIYKVVQDDMNAFHVVFSGAQDFNKVRDFFKQKAHKE